MKSDIVIVDDRVLHLGLAKGQLAQNVFLVGDPARALRVAEYFDDVHHDVRNREYVTLTGSWRGMPVSVIGTGIGVDNIEIALVEAYTVHAFDFDTRLRVSHEEPLRFVRIGTSGGTDEAIEPGTLAISTHGLGLDNGGMFYDHPAADEVVSQIEDKALRVLDDAIPDDARFKGKIIPYVSKASPVVVEALVEQARQSSFNYVTGITASTPGFYGASSRFVDGLANTVASIKTDLATMRVDGLSVVNMEMESSLLFHVAAHLGCQVGTICPIISKPLSSADIFDYKPSVDNAIRVALAAMYQLHGGDPQLPATGRIS